MPAPTTASPLRIAVLGTGKIGSIFAFQLARVGHHDVTVIARPGSIRLQQLRRDDGIIDVYGEWAHVRVLDVLDAETPYDLLIVTLFDHQVDAVLPSLKRSAVKCVQFMFNTFRPEQLRDAVGVERCAFGMPFVRGLIDSDGRLKAVIGRSQKTIMSEPRWVDLFNAAGIPASHEPDMPLWLRCHVPMCVAFESVAVAGERRGGGASWGKALVLARGVHASFGLIRALGYPIYPKGKKRLDGFPTPVLAAMLWSLSRIRSFREVLATGKAECAALVEAMAAAAHARRPDVVPAIRAMDPQ